MLSTRGICLTLLWLGSMAVTNTSGQDAQSGNRLGIRGRVVDDATGLPIESFTLQQGRVKGNASGNISWREYGRSVPNSYTHINGRAVVTDRNPRGEFFESLEVGGAESREVGLRVVADGYEPGAIADRPFAPTDGGKTIDVTVRLKRGRPLTGQVLDHAGRPAAGAKLFLIRPDGLQINIVDDVVGEGSDVGLLVPDLTRAVADPQGRFRLTGIGDANAIGVSADSIHFWSVPFPRPGEEPIIRLTQPGTIRLPYAIEGDEPETGFQLHFKVSDDPDGRLYVKRNPRVANHGELVLRDATPGDYTLWRIKAITHGDYHGNVGIDDRTFSIRSGEVTVLNFVRDRGSPVEGKVSGPAKGQSRMSFIGIEPVGGVAKNPPMLTQYIDITACDADGRFRTPRIPPGQYVVHAVGYRHQPRYGPFVPLIEAPDFTGSSTLVVPPDGKPREVHIQFDEPAGQVPPAQDKITSRR
jgi:hypothetical protein